VVSGVNHLTLSVSDIDLTFAFYTEVLGFSPIMKSEISAYFRCGTLWIAAVKEELYERKGYGHIAFSVDKTDFAKLVEKIKTCNLAEWQENVTEGDSFYFLDPSGNKMEIHCGTLGSRVKHGKETWGGNIQWYI